MVVRLLLVLLILSSPCFATPQQDFIDSIAWRAHDILPDRGIWPSAFIAQSCLESGFGTSWLYRNAGNPFGRKCGQEPCIEIMTPEEHDGVQVLEPHKFQVYGSLSEAIHDYADFINRRYASGERVYNIDASTPFTYIDSIAGRYASDSRYAWKVKSIIMEYDLQKYDW